MNANSSVAMPQAARAASLRPQPPSASSQSGIAIAAKPFVATHRRKDGEVMAMLLAIRDGTALYRVRYAEGKQTFTRLISASEKHFREKFA